MTVRRIAAAVVALGLIAAGCSSPEEPLVIRSTHPSTAAPPTAADPPPPAVPTGPGSAAAASRALCDVPAPERGHMTPSRGPTPPAIGQIEAVTSDVRGLSFRTNVPVEPLGGAELDARLRTAFDEGISSDQLARRSRAWATIGVVPAGTSIEEALHRYLEGQVIGFYVPSSGELVYLGSESPNLVEAVTLAHELTHALDDQHFDLERLDRLATSCRDERGQAASGAVEGSAQFFSLRAVAQLMPIADGTGLDGVDASLPAGVPPFITQMQLWPYTAGQRFIQARFDAGGIAAVNESLRRLPVSTEQVIHPERYPNDTPQQLDVPDLGPALGPGWRDLDVMEVGEEWLGSMLDLRIDGVRATAAAAGWDGGIYRAWTNGTGTAVVLRTVWDTPADARGFADGLRSWIEDGTGGGAAEVFTVEGAQVEAGFASSLSVLASLRAAA